MYQLSITKSEPRAEEEKKQILENRNGKNNYYNQAVNPEDLEYINNKIVKTLNIELTDEEFAVIKKAVVEIM